jgi:hypothetical protein
MSWALAGIDWKLRFPHTIENDSQVDVLQSLMSLDVYLGPTCALACCD